MTATHLPPTAIPERRYGRPGRDRIAGKPDEVATGAVHFRPGAVTLFFSDLEGSTTLLHSLGAQACAEAVVLTASQPAHVGGVQVEPVRAAMPWRW